MKLTFAAALVFVGLTLGVAATLWTVNVRAPHGLSTGKALDPRQAGLSKAWLAFGYFGQTLFASRMIVQWIATEKQRRSVVPVLFWWLSLFGGGLLLIYFVRRGDPVGAIGQLSGFVIYGRNLMLILRHQAADSKES